MHNQSQPAESETTTKTEFAVEGLNVSGRWEVWGVFEAEKSLNPAPTLEEARKIKGELDDYRLSEKTGWTDSRIVEVVSTVVRRVVS